MLPRASAKKQGIGQSNKKYDKNISGQLPKGDQANQDRKK